MQFTYKNIIVSIVVATATTMLFSCKNRLNEVRNWDVNAYGPQTSGEGINLFYTDSGKVRANLRSPKMLDFTNLEFSYREFPEGLQVDFFDEKNKKSTVTADYGIIYDQTDLVDLRGHVKIVTADSTILHAEQLYWDQARDWVFSDVPYTIKMDNGALNDGQGFDANKNFDKFISRSNVGVQYIDESKD